MAVRQIRLYFWIFVYVALLFCSIFYYNCINHIKSQHIYIASAHLVKDLDRHQRMIRILSAVEGNKINSKLYCQINQMSIKAKIVKLNHGIGCKWQYFFIECPIKDGNIKPMEFNLTDNSLSMKHFVKITRLDKQKRNFVICFSRTFNFERWQNLILALHFYKFYGVDLMVIPVVSIITELYTLLKAYENEGYVKLKSALIIPKIPELSYNPNEEIEVFNQVLNFDDCLYEYRERTDFMAFIDFDDLIQPQKYYSLYEELQYYAINYPNLASFEFQWAPTGGISSLNSSTFKMDKLVKSLAWANIPEYGKSVVRPMRIRHAFIHRPLSPKMELINGYGHKFFKDKNSTIIMHVRHLVEPKNAYKYFSNNKCLQNLNNCLHKNASYIIDEDFRSLLARNMDAKKAFNNLPSNFPYYEATLNCPQINKFGNCYSPFVCKPNVNIEKLSSCVVAEENERQTTTFADRLKMHSVWSRKFVERENCLQI